MNFTPQKHIELFYVNWKTYKKYYYRKAVNKNKIQQWLQKCTMENTIQNKLLIFKNNNTIKYSYGAPMCIKKNSYEKTP